MSNEVNNLKLTFNEEALYHDLITHFIRALDKVADELFYQMQSKTRNSVVARSIVKYVTLVGTKRIEAVVGTDHWAAFLDNYGTGSLMAGASQNPGVWDYITSRYWNPLRPATPGAPVVGRPPGDYVMPNYRQGYSDDVRWTAGTFQGQNMETIHKNQKFRPQSPSFFVETSMRIIGKRFDDIIMDAFNTFPWDNNKYLKGGA